MSFQFYKVNPAKTDLTNIHGISSKIIESGGM